MLVLTRKTQQQIQIGNNITVTIIRVKGQSVRIGIDAPNEVRVMRSELTQPAAKPAGKTKEQAAAKPAPQAASCAPKSQDDSGNGEQGACQQLPCSRLPLTRRTPGASTAPLVRRSQRLGPASLRAMAR